MARHFVRLKLRLLANRLRAGTVVGTIGFVAVWLVAVVLGGLIGLGVFAFGRVVEAPGLILTIVYTLTFLAWAVIPASLAALDETLDPRRFELLPLTPERLTAGLLTAASVSPGSIGTLIGLSVATFASFPDWRLVPIQIVAVLIELAMCLVVARLVTTFLANLLASRRTRELVTLGIAVVIGLVVFLPTLFDDGDGSGPQIEIEVDSLGWVDSMVWTPPGAVGASVGRAADGQVPLSIAMLGYGLAAALLIGWGWARMVRRMLVTTPSGGGRSRRKADPGRQLVLLPTWMRLRPGPVSGVAAKELRYLVRDNRVRSQMVGSFIPVVVLGFMFRDSMGGFEYAPFLAALVAYMIALGILSNQFGADGGSFWGYVVSTAPLASVLRGKNLGWGSMAAIPALIAAFVLSFWSGHFDYLGAAVLGSAAVLLLTITVANFTSIYGAQPIPESNPFASKGFSGNVFVAVILSLMVTGFVMLPLIVLVGFAAGLFGSVVATGAAIIGVGYGLLMYRIGMRLVTRLLRERQQTLLNTMDRDLD